MDYAVILAGGVGSRFWPLSRILLPKQFLKVTAANDSFLNAAIKRIRPLVPDKNIYISTTRAYFRKIRQQIKKFNIPLENIIIEPSALNTLPAVCLCAQIIHNKDPLANILVFPSDHYIRDSKKFQKTINRIRKISRQGSFCLIGIKPQKPHSGYGYIITGKKIGINSFQVKDYIEKPKITYARKLIKSKNVYWNSGMFCFKASTLLKLTRAYVPQLFRQISKIRSINSAQPFWKKIKPISIDYGILEKSRELVMVKGNFYWKDLGSWDAFYDISPKDKDYNVLLADSLNLESRGTLIFSYDRKRLIGTIGLEDLIIIDTPDSLLVCKKEKAQEIRKLVKKIKEKGKRNV